MADVVRDAIAAELALLERVVPMPTGDLGYGSDLAMTAEAIDIDPDMVERRGDDPLVLAEAMVRRLDTPRGALPDDRNYGYDVRGHLNRGTTRTEVRAMNAGVHGELIKDDRLRAVRVEVAPAPDGSEIAIAIQATPADPALAPFELVLAVTSAEVLIREIRR